MPWPECCEPASSAPSRATPRAPPDCRAAFRTPLARPARSGPTEPTTTAVMAGIASGHIPSSTDPATISASDVPAPATASSAAPAAARTNPVIMGGLGPRRAVSGPLAVEPTPSDAHRQDQQAGAQRRLVPRLLQEQRQA